MSLIKRLLPVLLLGNLAAVAQQKEFNYTELLQNKLPANFYNPLPLVIKWVDDEHVIVNRKAHPDSTAKNYILDVKKGTYTDAGNTASIGRGGMGRSEVTTTTGKYISVRDNDLYFKNNGQETRLTNNKDEEKNPTFSPDSMYVAYTRNNNLYSYNLSTNKETQLTTDGTSTTLKWLCKLGLLGRDLWSPNTLPCLLVEPR